MFLTRIQRGATRSGIILKVNAETLGLKYRNTIPSGIEVRTLVVVMTAAYTAVMPAMALHVEAAAPHPASSSEEVGEPPSTFPGLLPDSIESVTAQAQVTSGLAIAVDRLASISIGTSIDTEQQEAQAALLQQQQAAQALLAAQAAAAQAAVAAAARARQAALAAASYSVGSVQQAVHDAAVSVFGEDQWPALNTLISEESGFNPSSYNYSSGACGIFQALPCSKMGGTGIDNQIQWGINYIRNRYGTPSVALAFHNSHGYY